MTRGVGSRQQSWVAFTDNETLIGEATKNQAALNPERTIFTVKRLIGRRFDDPEVQRDIKSVEIKDGETKFCSPEEISAMIPTKMKETAKSFLGETIKDAVVAVPAYFNDAQKQATRDDRTIAGLNVGIIDELTAAVIAYNIDEKADKKNILVFDLGGGTFDVSILSVDNRVFDVLATNGDAHLGGEDFDRSIMKHFIGLIKKCGKDISKDKEELGKMRRECERAKRALSNQHEVRVDIESLYNGLNFSKWLTRTRFEELSGDLVRKTMGPVKKVLEDAGLERHQIDEIILVGGSTRILKVQLLLKDYFDGKEQNMSVNPEEAVAYGAAILGSILGGDFYKISGDILHLDLTRTDDKFLVSSGKIRTTVKEAKELAEKIDARSLLETRVNDMKNTIDDRDKVGDKLKRMARKMKAVVENALRWRKPNVSKEDYYNAEPEL